MFVDSPPAIVYEIPEKREEVSVMAFGIADPNLGVYTANTSVHFYDHFTNTKNARLMFAPHCRYNYSSIVVDGGCVLVEFDLTKDDLREDLGLYLTHLSADVHTGTYGSPVTVLFNDTVFLEKYTPQSHDWIKDDYFDLSALVEEGVLQEGTNTIRIQHHYSAYANYWLHCIIIK